MNTQPSLPGFEPGPPPQLHRTLFMLRLQGDAADDAFETGDALNHTGRLNGSKVRKGRLHCTLQHLDDSFGCVPDFIRRAATAAAERISFPSFEVRFDEVGSYSREAGVRAPLVLRGGDGLETLKTFQRTLGIALYEAGLPVDGCYDPHVTLLYSRQQIAARPILPISWTVTEFLLVESLVGLSIYNPLGRWSLRSS